MVNVIIRLRSKKGPPNFNVDERAYINFNTRRIKQQYEENKNRVKEIARMVHNRESGLSIAEGANLTVVADCLRTNFFKNVHCSEAELVFAFTKIANHMFGLKN